MAERASPWRLAGTGAVVPSAFEFLTDTSALMSKDSLKCWEKNKQKIKTILVD